MMLQCIVQSVPPSVNGSYATNFKTKRRFPSKELLAFKKLFNSASIHIFDGPTKTSLKDFLQEIKSKKLCLIVQVYFKKERLYTKDGRIKKLDISNRLKSCEDCICKAIGIDDSQIFRIVAEKIPTDTEEQTVISLMRHI